MTTLFAILGISFLIFIHELGHFGVAKFFRVKVLEFGIGFPPKLFGKKKGETEYTVNALPFGGFVRILGEDGEENESKEEHAEEEKDHSRSFVFQATWKKVAILAAGVLMNFVFGWLAFSAVYMVGIPEHLMITSVREGSPAAEAGLAPGDVVLSAKWDGEILEDPIPAADFIPFVARSVGNDLTLEIGRGNDVFERTVRARENPPAGEGALGVYLGDAGFPRENLFGALLRGAEETMEISVLVVKGFGDLARKIATTPQTAADDIAGPVGIVVIAKEASALGIIYFLQFLALISVNLAVLNMLPFPALDGGRIILALIERAKGSPVSRKIQIALNAGGLLLLVALMVFVTVGDIRRLF